MRRREILKLGVLGAAGAALSQTTLAHNLPGTPDAVPAGGGMPIIDAHIHLFDPTRPGGVPWPTPDDKALYMPAMPPRYEAMSAKQGVVGAIAIEASPLISDNDWLLKVVEANPVMVGAIGDLDPLSPSYSNDLERLHKNPLFLGFRTGNLWKRDLLADLKKPGYRNGLKVLAATGLVFESANPDGRLISALRQITECAPELRIVIDHLPNAKLPEAKSELEAFWVDVEALGKQPQVFVKLSEIPRRTEEKLVTDPAAYRAGLDRLWDIFGEDHVIFGSDWPNSDHVATYEETLSIVRDYIDTKSHTAQEKYFWKNSIAAYHWRPRRENQRLA